MKASPAVAKRKFLNGLPDLIPFIVTFLHVFISPYTKVEESFTLHAVHDILAYGFNISNLSNWDHITFPGAVPRSFLPPIILGLISYPFLALTVALGWVKTKLDVQIVIRLILASIFSHSINHLAKTLRTRYGPSIRIWFTILTLTSFHIPYYAGRTLPNFMAFPGVLYSISLILRSGSKSAPISITTKRLRTSIILLTGLATVVRLELALFLIPICISLVILRRATLLKVISWGMIGGFGSLLISSPIDYILWKPTIPHKSLPTFVSIWQILWPELSALHYNLYQGQSSNWGIMSKHYYFSNSLPKLLLSSLPLVLLSGLIWFLTILKFDLVGKEGKKVSEGVGEIMKLFGAGVVGLIGVMSLVGHKEWRFIIYSIPIFQIIASFAAAGLWNFPYPKLKPLVRLGLVGLVSVNIIATGGLTFISMNNYPGGEVWKVLEKVSRAQEPLIIIHFTSYPLQTGSTLFTFLHQHINSKPQLTPHSYSSSYSSNSTHLGIYSPFPPQSEPNWLYSKNEDEFYSTPEGLWYNDVDYIVTEDYEKFLDKEIDGEIGRWELVDEIRGLDGVGRGGKFGLEVRWGKKLVILGRKD